MKMEKDFRKVGIIAKHGIAPRADSVRVMVDELKKYTKELVYDEYTAPIFHAGKGLSKSDILKKCDLVVTMGGDGTLLKTARKLHKGKDTPIVSVHMGTRGFLTECIPSQFARVIKSIFKGEYCEDSRSLLRVTVYRNNRKYFTSLALNDAVINQGGFSRLIHLRVEVNKRKLTTYISDGLIISTPTGSTGHALAASGPIVHPKLEGIVLVPICPINLSARPIIIPNNRQFTVKLETEWREQKKPIVLTIDGQQTINLKLGDIIRVRKSSRTFTLLRVKGHNYYRMLRHKLGWSD